MSRLEELIQQYCPNGVEYKPLGEVCDIHKGVQFNKTDMKDEGSYPVINGGINPSGYVEVFNEEEETITISQGGASAGYVNFIMTRFWLGAHCYAVKPTQQVLNRYLYHFVKQNERTLQQCQYGAGIPALAKATIINLSIPVPPLPVQEEIVRILDSFAELQVELQAELQKRKQQYEYYRDKLLSFNDLSNWGGQNVSIEWKKLGEITAILRGKRLTKSQLSNDKPYAVYHGGLEPLGYYESANRTANTTMIINVGASAGTIGYSKEDFWSSDGCYCVEHSELFDDKYIYYVLQTQEQQLKSKVRVAGIPTLDRPVVEDLLVPIPPLNEQRRIVDILNRFEILTTDITVGLPAEIEARRKQYEYYRDTLLTFKHKA